VKELTIWFEARKWGWYPVGATRLPKKIVTMQLSDGTVQRVSLFDTVIEVGKYERDFSSEDLRQLEQLLVPTNGG
jgi:hypothetical protein